MTQPATVMNNIYTIVVAETLWLLRAYHHDLGVACRPLLQRFWLFTKTRSGQIVVRLGWKLLDTIIFCYYFQCNGCRQYFALDMPCWVNFKRREEALCRTCGAKNKIDYQAYKTTELKAGHALALANRTKSHGHFVAWQKLTATTIKLRVTFCVRWCRGVEENGHMCWRLGLEDVLRSVTMETKGCNVLFNGGIALAHTKTYERRFTPQVLHNETIASIRTIRNQRPSCQKWNSSPRVVQKEKNAAAQRVIQLGKLARQQNQEAAVTARIRGDHTPFNWDMS
jgi:hypothetical protein